MLGSRRYFFAFGTVVVLNFQTFQIFDDSILNIREYVVVCFNDIFYILVSDPLGDDLE